MTIKIEPGKSYRDREGRRWDYVGPSGDEDFPHWFCLTHSDTTSTFTDSGGYFLECIHYYDLIAEWTEPEVPPAERPEEHAPKTLRDEFAMAALTGLLGHASGESPRAAPAEAYVLADAMMEARK